MQHDFNLANAAGAAFRADMNLALLALVSNSSGLTEPSTTIAYQWWADMTAGLLKIRNSANTAWVTIGTLATTNLGLAPLAGGTFTGALLAFAGLVGSPGVAFSGDSDTGFYWVSANTWELVSGGTAYLRISPAGITFLGNGATTLLTGTTAQRPGSPVNGMIRYNSDLTSLDVYVNGGWATIPAVTAYPFTTADLANAVPLVPLQTFDFSGLNSSSLLYPQFPWSAPAKQTNPTSLPAGNGLSCAMTPNSEYVAVGHTTTPFITIYQRKGIELVKLADPATLPGSEAVDCAFSLSGEFLACAHATTPFVTIYQRTIGTSTWVKLANPTLPAGAATGVAWSPNGEFLSVTHATTPFVSIYQRTAVSTYTKIGNPASLPAGQGNGCAWSPDGRFLMVAHTTTPFVTIYERTAISTFTKVTNPGSLPAADGLGCAISNDGIYFAVVHGTTPFATIYTRSGTTFTKMVAGNSSQFSDSADYPAGQGNRCSFSLDGSYLAIAHDTTPFISNYLLTSGKWVKQANPSSLPAGNGKGVYWQAMREFLLVAHTTTPFLTLYQTASNMGTTNVFTLNKIYRAGT